MDGISLPLVVLNALLGFLAVLISWKIDLRPQLYFVLVLFLETAVTGVFMSLDLFLFFLFWELELAPMFLLIGIWGGPRREYAAMKFIIYTITGSAFMLVGILALFFFDRRWADLRHVPTSPAAAQGARRSSARSCCSCCCSSASRSRCRSSRSTPGCRTPTSRRRRRSACCWLACC